MNSVVNEFVKEFNIRVTKKRERRRTDYYDSISLESSFFSKMKIVGLSLGLNEAQVNVYTNKCKLVPNYYNLSARMFTIVLYYLERPGGGLVKKPIIPTSLEDVTKMTYSDIEYIFKITDVKEPNPINRLIAFKQYMTWILVHVNKVPLM